SRRRSCLLTRGADAHPPLVQVTEAYPVEAAGVAVGVAADASRREPGRVAGVGSDGAPDEVGEAGGAVRAFPRHPGGALGVLPAPFGHAALVFDLCAFALDGAQVAAPVRERVGAAEHDLVGPHLDGELVRALHTTYDQDGEAGELRERFWLPQFIEAA